MTLKNIDKLLTTYDLHDIHLQSDKYVCFYATLISIWWQSSSLIFLIFIWKGISIQAVLWSKIKINVVLALNSIYSVVGTIWKWPNVSYVISITDVECDIDKISLISLSNKAPFHLKDLIFWWNYNITQRTLSWYDYLFVWYWKKYEALKLWSWLLYFFHTWFQERNFLHIDTPYLSKEMPEGAWSFLVPFWKKKSYYYALTQSPQLFKQLLMIGKIEKYYQFVTCFWDEDLRADRQLEFKQLDVELSFVDEHMMHHLIICMINCMHRTLNLKYHYVDVLSYKECISYFKNDHPNLSTHSLDGIQFKPTSIIIHKNKYLPYRCRKLIKYLKNMYIDIESDTVLHINTITNLSFLLRLSLMKEIDHFWRSTWRYVLIYWMPLFEIKEDVIKSAHHPFVQPILNLDCSNLNVRAFWKMIRSDVHRIKGKNYDVILNGHEVIGGSIRIHDYKLQMYLLHVLKVHDVNNYDFFIQALSYGVPPHGGFAIGFDWLIQQLLLRMSLKDVIIFPKVQDGTCPVTRSPNWLPT